MPILEASEITKTFREGREAVRALRGISLTLERREIVALEGPSGSGKTTLLFILGCMLTPSSGWIRIDGQTVDARRPDRMPEIRRRAIGFVFQHYNLFPALTARENIEYALNLKGWRGRKAKREALRILEAVGLSDRRDSKPRDLSGGQKQRVAIARALAGPAPVLLADEPTASLDSQLGRDILDQLRSLVRQEDRALLIVTHDTKVRAIADRVVQIKDGQLVDQVVSEPVHEAG